MYFVSFKVRLFDIKYWKKKVYEQKRFIILLFIILNAMSLNGTRTLYIFFQYVSISFLVRSTQVL